MSSSVDPSSENLPSGPLSWMARNSVAANLLMLVFLVGGLILTTQVKQEVFPEFDTDLVSISVPYPGASPEEVEQGVVLSIEDEVRGLDGIKEVWGTAVEGSGSVLVELLNSAEPGKLLQDIKNSVDKIQSFPEEAERPVVALIEARRKVLSLIVYGDVPARALRDLAEQVRDDLLNRSGITLVELGVAPDLEIAVEVPQGQLRALNLTLDQIADRISRSALELPGGNVRTAGGQILLRTQERRDYASEYLDIPVATAADGTVLRLGDIAEVRDGFEESDLEATFNGLPAIRVDVYRVGDESPQSVSNEVRAYIAEMETQLPRGVGMMAWDDSSLIYQDRARLLLKNAGLGLILVLLLLGFSLEPRLAFWVTLGIPVSILGSFLFIPWTGASINMISLFAFIVTLGIVVDDAVVVGENIYEKRERGHSTLWASIVGVREISMPVVFAVLTNIVAFLPLFFVPGITGKFFQQIPAVTVGVFLVSLVESLFILPAHLAHEPSKAKIWSVLDRPRRYSEQMLRWLIEKTYLPAVQRFVRYRYATMGAALAAFLAAGGLVAGGHIEFTFIPRIDADRITAQAELPVGAPIEEARRIQAKLVAAAKRTLAETEGAEISLGIYSQIGARLERHGPGPAISGLGGSHIIATQIYLVPSDQREMSGMGFASEWRKRVGQLVGLESLIFKAQTGASEGAALDFELSHRNRETLERAASELALTLENYKGVTDIDDGVSTGKRQFSFKVQPEAQALGITASSLARQVRSSFYGAEALRQQRGRNEVKVMVRLPKQDRETANTLEELIIQTPQGGELPLLQAVELEEGRSYTSINRRNGRRVISVTADIEEDDANAAKIKDDVVENHIPRLIRKYQGLSYGLEGEQAAQKESMEALGIGFVFAMIGIYGLLAVPFKSYFQPLVVMLSIPFGAIGAVGGHFLLGYGLSIVSMFGLIALAGVVVNDSMVLVVTANRLREEGMAAADAVRRAAVRRFRPIILTSLTTFFGLAPMIFESSMQARFLIPMAISLGFGILFATVIILGIVPAVYLIIEDVKWLFTRLYSSSDDLVSENH